MATLLRMHRRRRHSPTVLAVVTSEERGAFQPRVIGTSDDATFGLVMYPTDYDDRGYTYELRMTVKEAKRLINRMAQTLHALDTYQATKEAERRATL